jgi:hypothetical protein
MSGKVGTGFPSDIAEIPKNPEREPIQLKRIMLQAGKEPKSKKTLTVRDPVPS